MSFISTDNLVLRAFRPSDVDRLAALWTDYELQRTEPSHVLPPRPDKLKARLPDIGFSAAYTVDPTNALAEGTARLADEVAARAAGALVA